MNNATRTPLYCLRRNWKRTWNPRRRGGTKAPREEMVLIVEGIPFEEWLRRRNAA